LPAAPSTSGDPYWAVCTLETSGGVGTKLAMLVFEPFPIARDRKDQIEMGVGSQFDRDVGVGTVMPGYKPFSSFSSDRCSTFLTDADARERRDRWSSTTNYGIVKFVEWHPGADRTGIGGGKSKSRVTGTAGGRGKPGDQSGATVERVKSSVDPAWDQKVLAEQQRQAGLKAKAAATALRNQAKAQAELVKFLSELRERGRAQ
jgi:hypothetical protein